MLIRSEALISRARLTPTWLADTAVAAAVGVPTMMDAWWNEPGTTQADALTYVLAGLSVVAVVARRRAPLVVTLVCGAALTGLYLRGHHGEMLNLPVMVGLYSVATHGDRRRTLVVAVVAAAWSGLLGFTSDDPLGARGGSPVLEMIWPLIPLALGEAVRARRELAALAAADQEREAARRVDAERTRMARELHDVLAHTLAAVNVQTAAAAAAFDRHPDVAREALAQARASGRAAIVELRATLHLLRDGDASAPAPGIDQLAGIISTARAAGLHVTTDIAPLPDLPAGIALAVHRVVQEAVTNTIRHSRARHLTITIGARDAELRVEVIDDGHPVHASPGASAGLGLVGMQERVSALAGHVEHGARPDGGYLVAASMPLPSARELVTPPTPSEEER